MGREPPLRLHRRGPRLLPLAGQVDADPGRRGLLVHHVGGDQRAEGQLARGQAVRAAERTSGGSGFSGPAEAPGGEGCGSVKAAPKV